MIACVCRGTADLERATQYYNALLAPMGAKMLMDFGRGRARGTAPDKPMLSAILPFDGQPAAPGNGTMTALYCTSKEQQALLLPLGVRNCGGPVPAAAETSAGQVFGKARAGSAVLRGMDGSGGARPLQAGCGRSTA